jgi:hypothetical protein
VAIFLIPVLLWVRRPVRRVARANHYGSLTSGY